MYQFEILLIQSMLSENLVSYLEEDNTHHVNVVR